jgi:hypothetical protein
MELVVQIPDELLKKLRRLADESSTETADLWGEDPDDVYRWGVADGRSDLALEILAALNVGT